MGVHRDTESEAQAEGFAERWSRLKQAREDKAEQAAEPSVPAESAGEAQAALSDEDMPPVESLDEHSDFAAFLSPGVSEQLRAQALRKLFQLPGLGIPDGLDDYDDDFSQFAGLGETITHEMRRMLERHTAERESSAAPRSADAAVTDTDEVETPQETEPKAQQFAAAEPITSATDEQKGGVE